MKRYAVFAGRLYYANGGWSDFVGAFETQQLAVNVAKRIERREAAHDPWWQVIDLHTGAAVEEGDNSSGYNPGGGLDSVIEERA